MKTIITLLLLCCLMFELNAQEDSIKNAQAKEIKQKLSELNKQYEALESEYKKDLENLQALKSEMDSVEKPDEYFDKLKKYVINKANIDSLNAINEKAQTYKNYYKYEIEKDKHGIGDSLNNYFSPREQIKIESDKESKEPRTLLYFGEDDVIAENKIFKNKEFNGVFKDLLSEKSETYLGDFIIPQDGQKLNTYKYLKKSDSIIKTRKFWFDKKLKYLNENDPFLFFKEVKIHILHGLLQDIKIIVKDKKGNELLFENKYPVSLLKYSRKATENYMFYRHTLSNNKDEIIDNKYKDYVIKLADVLMYINKPGENFVPDELKLDFPTKTNGKIENDISSVKYKVKQNTALENVLNLRTYTDFLSLFGDSPNGIFQFEGKGDFYLIPFNFPRSNMFSFKKISPYVNFARIDEEVRNLQVENNSITNSLEILEKAYLNMGVNLDVLSFKFGKEYPFEVTYYGKAQYNIADVKDVDSTSVNYKSLGLGGGLRIDIKRFNNFGFRMKSEFVNLNSDSFNTVNNLENTKDFVVFRNEAEIYYHPAKDSGQAVFLRLNTYNNSTENNNEAFYQLQFGYRFSIGINKLKN